MSDVTRLRELIGQVERDVQAHLAEAANCRRVGLSDARDEELARVHRWFLKQLTDLDEQGDWRAANGIPRRNCIDLNTPAELAIRAAIDAVEALPADVRLTAAVVALGDALNHVADFIDNVSAAPVDDCDVKPWMSCICERGTASCVKRHVVAPIVAPVQEQESMNDIKYGTLGVPLHLRREPTEHDFADPRFDVLWELMKRVDVDYRNGLFSGATGNDVCAVLDALDAASPSLPLTKER